MSEQLPGLHHMTAICGDAQRNVDFYVGVLGLRLVKKTVNFDDPGTYHLYYGDWQGNPGSILTFFAWAQAQRGRRGLGQVTATGLTVPEGALDYWKERLTKSGVSLGTVETRFGQSVLAFEDHDGLPLELITRPEAAMETADLWVGGPVPAQYAIRRMEGVTLTVAQREPTEKTLFALGFTLIGEEEGRLRYSAGQGESSTLADVLVSPDAPRGSLGVGIVHHVAWRTPSDETELDWRRQILEQGRSVSPVMDRDYFHSIYFHEPGGVLFEIATNPPGFTTDEPLESLGTRLCVPAWLEERRALLEQTLTPLRLPAPVVAEAP
ncbi:MAG: ring-cleaving dioxygenase [Cytophagales bacterium]|nr:ring-cleaving dioxygenase [Armatimonadota bacterium]